MKYQPNPKNDEAGFSLVELAVALVVIGLLMGAILKGQDLIESARLKALIMQINEYRYALATFEEKYGAPPGDFGSASKFLRSEIKDGNGSGSIEGYGLDSQSDAAKVWMHLAAAGLIADPGEFPASGNITFGKGAPPTCLGGGVSLEENPESDMVGLWFIVGKEQGERGNNSLVTPIQALQILKQMDSSDPAKGRVRALDGKDKPGKCIVDGQLNVQDTDPACVLYFKV
jgi:prepilin-type N-terminal cleavage/methylation domain-containing protein